MGFPLWEDRRSSSGTGRQVDVTELMVRLRIKYEKRGPIRFTSHRDLLRIFRRCFAAGEIPVRFSQGFNPHPKFSFGPSLRTGWEGLDEYMDVFLETPIDDAVSRCNTHLPDGFRVIETARVSESVPKLSADVKAARYGVVLDAVVRPEIKTLFVERVSERESRDDNDDRMYASKSSESSPVCGWVGAVGAVWWDVGRRGGCLVTDGYAQEG